MSEGLESLKSQLSALTAKERAELAHFLIRSLEDGGEEGTEAAWQAELTRRVEDIDSGRVTGKPAEEILPELRDEQP